MKDSGWFSRLLLDEAADDFLEFCDLIDVDCCFE
jgi:hypothetical protein